jgi:ABC-type phosphate transport system auxiliary subunit
MALSQMAEQIKGFSAQNHQNLKKPDSLPNGIKGTSESVDLDNLFAFLSEVTPNGQNNNSNAIISEIGEKMNNLVDDLDVELESVIQQEIEGLTNERNRLETKLQHHVQQNNNHQQQMNNHQLQHPIPPPPIPGQVKLG